MRALLKPLLTFDVFLMSAAIVGCALVLAFDLMIPLTEGSA